MSKVNDFMEAVFFAGGRGSGRTHAMMEAAKLCPNALVLVVSESQAQELKKRYPGVDVRSPISNEKLLGMRRPILLDHFLLQRMWQEREEEIERKMRKLKEAINEVLR